MADKQVFEPAPCVLVRVAGMPNLADDPFTHTGDDEYELFSEDRSVSYGKAVIKPNSGSALKQTIFLPNSPCNRKYIIMATVAKYFTENDALLLEYKASRHLDGVGHTSYTIGQPLKKDAKLVAFLNDEQMAEYQAIIDRTIETYNAQAPKELTELEKAQIALRKAERKLAELNGETFEDDETDIKTGRKGILDCMTEDDYVRYDELLTIAGEAKAKAPRTSTKGKPLSKETQIKMAEARKKKAEETIARLLAQMNGEDVG